MIRLNNLFHKEKLSLFLSIVLSIFFLLIIALIIILQNKLTNNSLNSSTTEWDITKKAIITISKLVYLPTNESPTYSTISEQEKLKSIPFFKDAQNGDIVLIYNQAKKVYIYRPIENKIVNIASISTSSSRTK